ncbi:MAG: hypothetical protein WCT28_03225 [Patescibacteria group bacterium]|jgi:hypothetical protein
MPTCPFLFQIIGGKLKPTDPARANFSDVLRFCRPVISFVDERSDVSLPNPSEETVVVADSWFPFYRVPEGGFVITRFQRCDPCDVILFRVIDQDNGGKVRIVAALEQETCKDPSAWKIVSSDEWIQVGENRILIRAFPSLEEARMQIVDGRLVIVPFDDAVTGWRSVLVHGYDIEGQPVGACNAYVVQRLGIPDGLLEPESDVCEIKGILDKSPFPFQDKDHVNVTRVILTEAGVYLVAEQMDGRNGIRFFAREFTREEVKGKIFL